MVHFPDFSSDPENGRSDLVTKINVHLVFQAHTFGILSLVARNLFALALWPLEAVKHEVACFFELCKERLFRCLV